MTGGAMVSEEAVVLRDIAAADIALLYTWRNDAETRVMFCDDRPLDFDSHSRFVQRYLADPQGDHWWIVEAAGVPVGTICLFHFSDDRRSCEFGRFVIAPEHRGGGYGRLSLQLAMSYARSILVERMRCVVLSSNERALNLYRSLGFGVKGVEDSGPRRFVVMEAGLA